MDTPTAARMMAKNTCAHDQAGQEGPFWGSQVSAPEHDDAELQKTSQAEPLRSTVSAALAYLEEVRQREVVVLDQLSTIPEDET